VGSLPKRIGLAAAGGIFALIVFGTTLWFLGDALLLLLEANGFSPPAAAGLTGLAGLVLTGLIGLLAKGALRQPSRAAAAPPLPASAATNSAVNAYVAEVGTIVARQIIASTRAHPYKTMGAALAAGLAVGAVPELRNTLTGLLKR